jgi:hypothetical protein
MEECESMAEKIAGMGNTHGAGGSKGENCDPAGYVEENDEAGGAERA